MHRLAAALLALVVGLPQPHVDHRSALAHHSHVRWAMERHHAAELRTARTLLRREILVDLWTPVALCEEGGWVGYSGPAFPDSLGIMASAWHQYGGGVDLRPFVQAEVGMRLIAALGAPLPDRGGCAAW